MKIKDVMRTNVSAEPLKESLLGELSVFDLSEADLVAGVVYGVVDASGTKMGEISGEQLLYLIGAWHTLALDQVLDGIDDGIVVIDADGRICFENRAYAHIFGVPMRKTIGKDLHAIEPEALLLNVLKTGRPTYKKRQLVRSVGKYVEVRMFPIEGAGRVLGAFSVFRDVTELQALGSEVKRIAGVAEEMGSQLHAQQVAGKFNMVTRSKGFQDVLSRAQIVAPTDANVLIRGENGVGKELLTRFIHSNSKRRNMPLIAVNCAAIPETLIESELFGYEEGAFTGAKRGGKTGKFELAHGGTLFLDEIGDMSLLMQTKLLRALQEGEIEKIGRTGAIPVDVRVIAATNQPLEQFMREKRFREDLYFRLNVLSLKVPPLRERAEDIPLLANYFLSHFNEKYGKDVVFRESVYRMLTAYSWPGNIRELENCVESAVVMCSDGAVSHIDLPEKAFSIPAALDAVSGNRTLGPLETASAEFEAQYIMSVLNACGGDLDRALEILKISRRTFYRKRQRQ